MLSKTVEIRKNCSCRCKGLRIEADIGIYTKIGGKRPLIHQCCSVTQKEQPLKLKPVE